MAKKITNKVSPKKSQVGQKKSGNKKKNSKYPVLKFIGNAIAVLILLGVIFFFMVFFGILGPVPSKQQLHIINNPVASEVFSADGKILGRYYVENRSNVKFDEISPNVINALIATEDARFYEHRGIDEVALMRVLIKSILLQNSSSGGGSTLSQQIAKNLFPRVNYGVFSMPVNKIRESIIAYRLERIYTKQEILALYLNTVPFAENTYGIEVAAERFFSKAPSALDVDEAAVIIGMLKANNYYNPNTHPERAKERRDVVINQMAKYEYLTEEQAEKYKSKPLKLKYRVISYNQGPAPYFLEMLKPQLLQWCKNHKNEDGENYNLYTDGLKIKTTLDYNLQYYAQQSVKEYMKNLQRVFDDHWKHRDIFKENPEIIKSAERRTKSEYQNPDLNFNAEIKTHLFTWNGVKDTVITRLDSLKHYQKLLNAGFIALSPQTGELKAWVGGIDFRFFKYDHVTAPRQTGSVFKPFVYLSALERGIPADKYFVNQLKVYEEYDNWEPKNSHDEYGGYYSMKGALAKSLNTVSVDVLLEAGIPETIELVRDFGISADLPKYPSLALGVASVSLMEIAEAFAGIANDGLPVKAYYLVEITDSNDKVLETFNYQPETNRVASAENCRAVLNMMQSVVEEGTGRGIRTTYNIQGDFAGKTGTTQNNSDGWFIGITPDLVTGCWVGADDPRVHFRTTTLGQGAYMALPIVGKFYSKTYSDPKFSKLKYKTFAQPEPELLAMLDIPQYKEMLDIDKKEFDIAGLFKSKEEREKLRASKEREINKNTEENKPFWNKIKNIFKKKDK
ncbi:MAG: transglycosylase domain-containing protein [Draconibacterium sp.]